MENKKLSEVENIKESSRYLRGSIEASLENELTGAFFPDDTQLIKFHGFYQQTDRELDSERKQQKLEPLYSFMIRIRVPGGRMSPAQYLRLNELTTLYGSQTLKITTRQAIQIHGIYKKNLKAVIRGFNEVKMDSIAGCGDVNRNVMAPINPYLSPAHKEVVEDALLISAHFTPRTTAYYEIWINGEEQKSAKPDEEPIYGKTYLPRKFKIALAIPPHNDTDIYANDIGIVAIVEDGQLLGYNILAGGGLGMTFGMPETYPRLADMLGYISRADLILVCEAILTTQRDWGNREDRKFSRLKYTIDRVGLALFKLEVESRAGIRFLPEREFIFSRNGDHYGWSENVDGTSNYLLFVEGGRIADDVGKYRLQIKTALCEIARIQKGDFRLTGNQNILIASISPHNKEAIARILLGYGLTEENHLTALRKNSLACVALNTCPLAFAEAERYLPQLLDRIELLLYEWGLSQEEITIRMTGCPNGCARPYLAEIGLVGRSLGKYNLYLGAAFNGERLNKRYREMLGEDDIINELRPLLADYALNRYEGERLGDFVIRKEYIKPTIKGLDFHL